MRPPTITGPDFSTNVIEKEYSGGKLFFVSEFHGDQKVNQNMGPSSWVIDFALDEVVQIDGRPLPAGVWQITKCSTEVRKLTSVGKNKGNFFSIVLSGNPYVNMENRVQNTGLFTTHMAYPILKLISRKVEPPYEGNDIWIESYIHLLLIHLNLRSSTKVPAFFGELKTIYEIIERLNKSTSEFPTPTALVDESGMKIFRFQKGCLALYGQSAKKVIQHLKMKTAFDEILVRKQGIGLTSAKLGYDHTSNFITAFHKHFGITPAEAVHHYHSFVF